MPAVPVFALEEIVRPDWLEASGEESLYTLRVSGKPPPNRIVGISLSNRNGSKRIDGTTGFGLLFI